MEFMYWRSWTELFSTEGIERGFLVRRELDGALAQRELDRVLAYRRKICCLFL